MRNRITIALILIFAIAINIGYSQTFPVQATVQLTPPYSLNLSDYSSPDSERLAFMILLADVNRPELQVKFRLRIEGQGIEIITSQAYNPPPYILQGGIPERITGFDLASYFNPASLDFRGLSRAQYQQTSRLPEGLYRICIEVVEYNRNVVVSNTGCSSAWLILNDPPIVNIPRNDDKIRILNPQNIIFQWTPRHTGSPNSAFRTDYECTLVELWPETRNPNDAILSSPPILQETTSSTTFVYGPAETPLVAGRHYAFRVQAKSISGIAELDLFKNNGYSEVITFRYGDPCLAPEPVTATVMDPERIKLEWTANAQHTEYAVQYRPSGTTQWYDQETFLPYTTLVNLKSGTTYEYQVKAVCGPVDSEAGKRGSATTKESEPSGLVCGTSLPVISLDNTQLLNQLNPGDVVEAGDFSVTIKRVTGTGSFTGSGTVDVAFFKNAKVNVEFESIKVNPEYRMVEGTMEVKGVGIDVLPDKMTDLMDQLSEALAQADDVLNEASQGLGLADEILNEVGELANELVDDGLYVQGEEHFTMEQYLAEAKKAMQSATGALASAASVGSSSEAARGVAQAATLKSRANRLKKIYEQSDTLKVIAVEFVANDPYGFDKQEHQAHRLHYNIMVTPDKKATGIPWAAMKAGEGATVTARLIPSAGIRAENIEFKAGEIVLASNQNGNEWTVALPSMDAGATLTVRAIDNATQNTVGKLDVVSYAPIVRKVNLIPVGDAPVSLASEAVRDELNRIYKHAVAEWEVAVRPRLEVPGYTGTLQDDEQALLSVYSDGMKEIIRAFEVSGDFNKEEFYLFLVDKSQTGKAGYMPRKHRYGFIYQNENASPLQTIAHELGHGAFRLQHTFEEYPSITVATSNLMDYHNGTQLKKYQWDLIHNPPLVIGLLEDESEGAYETDGHYSTVYLVAMLLGMREGDAKELAISTEAPDTDIHDELDFELDQTWSYFGDQQNVHSLTGGFHGIEEMMTAFKFLATPKSNKTRLGELLHRYGDTYAHTKLDNILPEFLKETTFTSDNEKLEVYIASWRDQGGPQINDRIEPWITFLNRQLNIFGYSYFTNEMEQRATLKGKTLIEYLHSIYLNQPEDKFQMYGNSFFTLEHASKDRGLPDFIYVRPNWYLTYVKNLTTLLAYKYNLDLGSFNIAVFERMVTFATQNRCKLKGVIDFEIAREKNENVFYIPVFYSKAQRVMASFDAVFFTNYLKEANDAKNFTLKYMKEIGINNIEIIEKKGNYKINNSKVYELQAYEIKF